jgi:single-stranded-DNA-specific exonuclease
LTLTWRVRPIDDATIARLRDELRVRPLTAAVLAARGLDEPAAAARFLAPKLADLRPPEGIADLDRALDRLMPAVTAGERIGVFGDYDVDGVTTAAVLTTMLRAFGAQVVARVARRSSGYGLSPADATRFLDEGCTLVVTGDCGTSDGEAIEICRAPPCTLGAVRRLCAAQPASQRRQVSLQGPRLVRRGVLSGGSPAYTSARTSSPGSRWL